jgi:hypothetical protein
VPYDYTAPPGTPCTRQLVSFEHRATIEFDRSGTATIRVRGIDRRTKSAQNMSGTAIVVERQVVLSQGIVSGTVHVPVTAASVRR